jgi:hypothetical protein
VGTLVALLVFYNLQPYGNIIIKRIGLKERERILFQTKG